MSSALERFDASSFVTTADAAKILGVTARTIRRHCERRTFPGARHRFPDDSSHWLIPREDLEALMSDMSGMSDASDK